MAGDPLALALQLARAGRLAEAMQHCERILAGRPMHATALGLSGAIALRNGDTATAIKRLTLAASIEPRNPGHRANLGDALSASGRTAEAIEAYRHAIRLDPRNARAHNGLALALQDSGDSAGALDAFARAASLDRKAADIHINLGAALQRAGRLEEAAAALRRAIALAPDDPDGHFNLGVALAASGDLEGAEAEYAATLRLSPGHARALNNLGRVFELRGDREAALRHYEAALATAPEHPEAWYNRANMLKELGRYAEAVPAYDRALALNPDAPDARKNRGLLLLTLGEFSRGWSDHRAREAPRERADQPLEALPSGLDGQHILVIREQGVGDELFFLRFAPTLAARGARVSALVDPRLVGMMSRTGIFAEVLGPDGDRGGFDRRLLMADLPFLLGHASAEACPPPLSIPPDAASLARMHARLEAIGPRPWIAVTWRAGVPGKTLRAVPPGLFGAALAGSRGTVVLVQRKPAAEDVAAFVGALGRAAADMTDVNENLEDMLALMSLVDVYASVSNTNVHLRASAGRALHVLVPHPPEWRWFAQGQSPWFREAKVYRQAADGDWQVALAQMGRDLSA